MENYTYECTNCGKTHNRKYKSIGVNHFCCKQCQIEFQRKKQPMKKCKVCGKTFKAINKNHLYCSAECKKKQCMEDRKLQTYVCDYCGKEFHTKEKRNMKNKFCGRECYFNYSKEKTKEKNRHICKFCKKEYVFKDKKQQFCSVSCQNKWQSNVMKRKYIRSGSTRIQMKINSILSSKNIHYKNEYSYKYYKMDNYLTDSNLCLEIMGEYWHCDNRIYEQISTMQKNSILRDKRKNSFVYSNYNINILYLWESEINNFPKLCEMLIDKYIAEKGKLKNYHSFNYHIGDNDEILLNDKIIIPYMEFNIEDINEKIKK